MIILFERHKPQSSHLSADVNTERGERGFGLLGEHSGGRSTEPSATGLRMPSHCRYTHSKGSCLFTNKQANKYT